MIFDEFASEYGYTIEYFLTLTMRQVVSLRRAMRIRRTTETYYEMRFHASLKGAEIPSLEEVLGVECEEGAEFSQEQDKRMQERAEAILREQRILTRGR